MELDDRAAWSFGRLLEWHLLRGTRPGGRLDHPGRKWSVKAFSEAVGVGDRTVRYWLKDEHLPPEIETIERVMFGNDACYAEWRLGLRRAHAKSWAAKGTGETARAALQEEPRSLASSRPAVSNIPIRVPTHFMGRDEALAAIETALKHRQGLVAITALHGLRGIGKTTLAATFAERHHGDYRATWWIRAQAEPSMRADLTALGVRLGWIDVEHEEDLAVAATLELLRHQGEGILLIYDNATDACSLKPYLPRGGAARVLVTSNAPAWRQLATPLELGLWPKEVGADYLIARTGCTAERAAAQELSEDLGGLPLAHEQAAAYCERLGISLGEYRERLLCAPTRLLNDPRYAPSEYHDGLTVTKTFALAIDRAAGLNAAAEPLIVYAALLAPEAIPLLLFSEAQKKVGEPLASLTRDNLDEAVAVLRVFALLDRETLIDERDASITTHAIRLHRLVREVASARRDDETRDQMRRTLVAALAVVYPADGFNNPTSWPRCALLTPHVLTICETESTDNATNAGRADLLQRAASYFYGRAAYSQAQALFERAIAIRESVFGPGHPLTAYSLNNLAVLLKDCGNLKGARPLFERALAIWEKALGPAHPDTTASLNNLATQLQAEGDLAGARRLFERALTNWERLLGPEHPDTATGLSNLAFVLQAEGDLAAARVLFERALAIYEKVLGPEQAHTAAGLNNLGHLIEHQGDLAGARRLFERALTIYVQVLGPEHPTTDHVRQNFERLLHADVNSYKAERIEGDECL